MFDEGVSPNICSIMGGENSSQLRMIFILSHPSIKYPCHKSKTIFPSSYHPLTVHLPFTYRPIVLLSSSNRPPTTPPLISHNTIPPNIYPYTTPYIPKNTHPIQKIPILKASFLS